jgi:hypothetical protein
VTGPLVLNNDVNYQPYLGQNVEGSFYIKNNTGGSMTLDSYTVGVRYNDGTLEDFTYGNPVSLGTGQEKKLAVTKRITRPDAAYIWVKLDVQGFWFIPENNSFTRRDYSYTPREPNIKASWFLVPDVSGIGSIFTPELRIINYEGSPITLDSVGIANWYNWPEPNMNDFGFKTVTIGPGEEKNIPFDPQRLDKIGRYRAWSLYRIGDNWYQLYHTTGYPDIAWMNTREPNIKASWFMVPENSGGSFVPELRIINYENYPVQIDSAGIACWLNWPQQNMRDFGFQTVTINPGEEKNIPYGQVNLTEPGRYRIWSPYRIGDNWYQLYHTTGYPDIAWINVY